MKSSFPSCAARLHNTLAKCWPSLSNVDWAQYGDKIVPYGANGLPKYTGMISHLVTYAAVDAPVTGINTQVYGFMPRPEASLEVLMTKIKLLQGNVNCRASMELREPENGKWGGAIRSTIDSGIIFAISGLPEIADHLMVAIIMQRFCLLSNHDCFELTNGVNGCLVPARHYVGMSLEQFHMMSRDISDIVSHSLAT